ncbi:MAG: hypothetical protein BGO81_05960 [Devosia sp. 66-22]|nr:MAG: hypothetical protein BGO81_05960 [Devosia sp. 66-22]
MDSRTDRLSQLAAGISVDEADVTKDPVLRFRRDVMSIHHLRFSFARSLLEGKIAKRIAEGWEQAWASQRFLLKAPLRHETEFAKLIAAARSGGLAEAAALVVAASDLVNHGLADGWLDIPRQLSRSLAAQGA